MIVLILSACLAASPHSLAMPGVNVVGLAPGSGTLLSEIAAQELTKRGLKVLSARDIESVLGLERQKELLGCAAQSSCIAELAGALGVDGLLIGDLGKIGTDFAVNLRVLNALDGTTLALFNERTGDETRLPSLLTRAAGALADQLQAHGWLEGQRARGSLRLWSILPGLIGVAGVATSVGLALDAQAQWVALKVAPSLESATTARDTGRREELIGNIAMGVGITGLVAAAVLLVLPEPMPLRPFAWASPAGSGFGLSGGFP
jgi:hypothetical protein